MLEVALDCIRRGWFVVPCYPGTKIPSTKHGFKNNTNDEAEVRAWWGKFPSHNVGIVPGESGLTILDIDKGIRDKAHAMEILASMPEAGYAVHTGNRPEYRLQVYFLGGNLRSVPWAKDGLSGDIRSGSGLAMAAGSIHPDSGEWYELVLDKGELKHAPQWVIDLKPPEYKNTDGTRKKLGKGDGQRPNMTRLAGKYRDMGDDGDTILAKLILDNPEWNEPPLPEHYLEAIAHSVSTLYPAGAQAPEIVFGGGNEKAEAVPAELPERVRPKYPFHVWSGTVVGDFAELCGADNNIPKKLYAEAFRCALGAVVGNRLSCPTLQGALSRSYTILIAPKGKGKGTAVRHAVKFFSEEWSNPHVSFEPGLLSGNADFLWKPKGIGAWMAGASSVPGMARLVAEKKNKTTITATWGGTTPRILSVYEEIKGFLSTLFIEGGVGAGMEGIVCQLWDDITFQGTATGTRDAVYGEMQFSMLCGVTPEDWFNLLSRGDAVGGGLMSRLNLVGTEGEYLNVGSMDEPDFTALRESFLPRVTALENTPALLTASRAARDLVRDWVVGLPDGSERMNIHVWRSAVLLSWLRAETEISAEIAGDAIALGDYQVASQAFYRTRPADTPNARVQAKQLRALEMHGPLTKRDLQQKTHASRDGTDLWNRALDGLIRDGAIGKRGDGTLYRAE